jgi:DNA topoisomerase-2
LYGAHSAIRKYPDAEAILREHFDVRLDAYTRRKAFLDAELESALKVLNAKARFVREVISQDIKLLGIKNADLEEILDAREYERIENSFGYLTRMPMSSLTAEKASALDDDAKCKGLELEELRATSERAMWLKELDELETAL